MSFQRIAVIFDRDLRPETTGTYCLRALQRLVARAEHVAPKDVERLQPGQYDLYLNIDDGLQYRLPPHLRPSAWWVIDTHLAPEWAEEKAHDFEWVFAAQQDGARLLTAAGLPTTWLPLACDPEIHRPHGVPKRFDVGFVGRMAPGPRQHLLQQIARQIPNTFVGQRCFDEYAKTLSESRIGFNRSVANDVNMRVFETLGCGTLLTTNDLAANGQDELLVPDKHLVTYRGEEELMDKLRYYLQRQDVRERIAAAGNQEVLARHTYRHRMQTLLETIASTPSRTVVPAASPNVAPAPPAWIEQVDFVIKTFLRPQALLRLLRSILHFYPQAHVTVADDGNLQTSPDADSLACRGHFEQHERFTLVELPFGSGVTPGRNALIERTHRPFVLLLDDDFCFTDETRIERLFERLLKSDPALGAVAGLCRDVDGESHQIRKSGGTLEVRGDVLVHDMQGWRDGDQGLCDYIPHFALFRRELFDDVRWEADLGGDHYDFLLQLKHSRWKVAQDSSVIVDHHHFTSALPGYVQRRADVHAGQQAFLRKWTLRRMVQDGQVILEREREPVAEASGRPTPLPTKDASYFDFPRPEVLALVPLEARHVLDIGCGAGRLGASIKSRQEAEVVGIELQPKAAGQARQCLDQVLERNVEGDVEFPAGRFDCVICADVLEHLREPDKVLARIRRWLTPDGVLVASLPNVRNHSVISGLLDGNWTYEAAGLLDNDHVRFFTRREIDKLFFRAGFAIESWHANPGPGYANWEQAGRPGSVQAGRLRIEGISPADAEEFFVYQYLVVAKPNVERFVAPRDPPLEQEQRFAELAAANSWPSSRPNVPLPTDNLGWFEAGARGLLARTLQPDMRLVVELGAWLGLSTRFIADRVPNAKVITVDHWQGSPEHRSRPHWAAMLPTLFETFQAMNWDYCDRILPLRMDTLAGLRAIHQAGLKPDLIFVDADHTYRSVAADLAKCQELFPEALLVGDDYDAPDVRRAVDEFVARNGFTLETTSDNWRAWRVVRPVAPRSTAVDEDGLTSIILVTFNQLAYTKECLDSIRLRTDEPFELILIDNGSTDGTPDYLQSLPDATVILNANNRGFPAAVNQGLKVARGKQILLLNNDTLVTTGWLRRMLDALKRDAKIGLVGPCSNAISGPQEIPVTYQDLSCLDGFAWTWGRANSGRMQVTDRLTGFCLLIRREVVDRIGVFDERFGIGCFEDDDYCRRAIAAGYDCVIAQDAFVHHFQSRSFAGAGFDLGQILRENGEKYAAKWGQTNAAGESPALVADALPASPAQPISQGHLRVRRYPRGGLLLDAGPRRSLCMIVRDNERTIRPALESIRPYVDEMVVVDTGSLDRTRDICRELGAKVFHFPWCDDFAAARNESLKHATGEWIFWMDSDDTIPPECGSLLPKLLESGVPPHILGIVMQVHCPDQADDPHDRTIVDHVKLFRNRPDLRFEGRIHEQILPSIRRAGGSVAFSEIFVVHSGAERSPEGKRRKLERDFRILKLDLQERPDHPFVLFNLGMTCLDASQSGEAVQYLQRCLAVSHPGDSHVRKAYALLVAALTQGGRQSEADEVCQVARKTFPDDPELRFREALLYQQTGRRDAAADAYRQLLDLKAPREFSSVVAGLQGFKCRQNLALVLEEAEKFAEAEAEWRQIVVEVPDYRPGWRGLGEVLIRQQRFDALRTLLSDLNSRGGAWAREALILEAKSLAAKQDWQRAILLLERADVMDAGQTDALQLIAQLLFTHAGPEAAEATIQEILRRLPDDPSGLHNLGSIRHSQQRLSEAEDLFRRSISHRPDATQTRMFLAAVLLSEHRSTEALSEIEAACRRDKSVDPWAWLRNLGVPDELVPNHLKQPTGLAI